MEFNRAIAQPCANPACDNTFIPYVGGKPQIYCGRMCAQRHRRALASPPVLVKCEHPPCQNTIEASMGRRFCSGACKQRAFYYRPENLARYREMHNELGKQRRQAMQDAPIDERARAERARQASVYYQRRRALKRGVDQRLVTPRDLRRLYARQDDRCFYCGKRVKLTIDHVIPLSRGGRESIGNYAGACGTCNSSKGPLLIMEFRLDRPRVVPNAKVRKVRSGPPAPARPAPAPEVLHDLSPTA